MVRINLEPYFHTMNGPFRAFQNSVSEHSVEGVPASLHNLTKSAPDSSALNDFHDGIEWNEVSTSIVVS